MKDLTELREKIDLIDQQMVSLYEERMRLTEEVAEYKIASGKKVLDKAREDEKLQSVTSLTESDFTAQCIRELFTQIMSMSRKRQYQLLAERESATDLIFTQVESLKKPSFRAVYQGEEGAYAQAALYAFFGKDTDCYHVETWRDALREITEGRADYAVLPFENSSAGFVTENYDLILEYDVSIAGEQIIPVEHCLLATEEIPLDQIKRVFSHPQALMQCSRFLEQHRGMERISLKNTAAAAKKISDEKENDQAAIASGLTADIYGLQILQKGIQNNDSNSTRFFILSKDKLYVKNAAKLSLSFEIPHESGSLYRALSHFIYNGLNMNRIESRPIQGKNWEYRFFIDIDGNLNDSAVKNALRGLAEETNQLRVLGNY